MTAAEYMDNIVRYIQKHPGHTYTYICKWFADVPHLDVMLAILEAGRILKTVEKNHTKYYYICGKETQ